jgi:hypothetical protein
MEQASVQSYPGTGKENQKIKITLTSVILFYKTKK